MLGFVPLADYTKVCQERDQALAERDYYRSELGLTADAALRAELQNRLGLTVGQAAIMAALHRAKHRFLSKDTLGSVGPQRCDGPLEVAKAQICQIRRKLGGGVIETAWGLGYRLSESGRGLVETAIKRVA